MAIRVQHIWSRLQGSMWFLPSVAVLAAVGLAFLLVWADRTVGDQVIGALPLLFEAGPEGAREILSVIAGSMLTVAGVAFSFTMVVFSFASSQYSSRSLRNFMDDTTNQAVLGVLLGSFVYCLLVLRTVRLEGNGPVASAFVPPLSITVALLLALLDLGLVILFLHHVAESIQAYHVVNRVGQATSKAMSDALPEKRDEATPANPANPGARHMPGTGDGADGEDPGGLVLAASRVSVLSKSSGYIQALDVERNVRTATEHNLVVVLKKGVGDFVLVGKVLAEVGSRSGRPVTEGVCGSIRDSFVLGPNRTLQQDALYGILQLSDVAVKALSPGINDPTTALMCLNQLGQVLSEAARRPPPEAIRHDEAGVVRVRVRTADFCALAAQSFDQIRRYGISDAAIPASMLDIIAEIAEETRNDAYLAVLKEHVLALREDCDREIGSSYDRALINERLAALVANDLLGDFDLLPLSPIWR